jgi:hypothetical protein
MTSREFCYWLQGYFEIKNKGLVGVVESLQLSPHQIEIIQNHLALVFKHEIDPSYSIDPKVQQEMNEIHSPNKPPLTPKFGDGRDGQGNMMRC